jgi:predicted nucleotide-binding protein
VEGFSKISANVLPSKSFLALSPSFRSLFSSFAFSIISSISACDRSNIEMRLHDHGRMQAVARFIEYLELSPIILHERASKGSTIIEKLEKHASVAFAIILLTPDDVGSIATDQNDLRPRARQNVVLELGYFMGKLGRMRTCALIVEGVEIPTDYSGVIYILIDENDAWKFKLAKELRAVGLPINMNRVL